ncbi:hypothetical protein GA0061102_102730 [Rhizobium miluonense]|uniref:Uncharacterized protein n=1 Tax=Rhizobium miluonense TaxID=411945 RepID=A0A1C3WDC6_9HYPH|nr:hypothetical protein GA0061102_102730 [Rhizobium miluonense]
MSDRVAVMLEGNLLQIAPPAEIYADPQDNIGYLPNNQVTVETTEFLGNYYKNYVNQAISAKR